MSDLQNQVALITGGGSGIGRAIAASLSEEGCRVVIIGRTESLLRDAADSIGDVATWKTCDVANQAEEVAACVISLAKLPPQR